jgi:hypothetical protein
MKSQLAGRAMGCFVLAFFMALYVSNDYSRWSVKGKDLFLAKEGARFDRYMAHPRSFAYWLMASLFVVLFSTAIYESIAFVSSRVFKRISGEKQN